MDDYGSYLCSACKISFPFQNIKYGIDGKSIVCADCFNKSSRESNSLSTGFGAFKNSGIIKFICIDCRYHFSLKKNSRINKICPYCGKNKLMVDEATANNLIDEASKDIGAY